MNAPRHVTSIRDILVPGLTVLTLIFASTARGGISLGSAELFVRAFVHTDDGASDDEDFRTVTVGPTTASATVTGTGSPSAFASADYGVLRASAIGTDTSDLAEATACFDDVLTILGSTGPGTIQFVFDVTGSIDQTTSGLSGGSATARLALGGSSGSVLDTTFQVPDPDSGGLATIDTTVTSSPMSFFFGAPFPITGFLESDVTKVGDVDFASTAVVTGLLVEDPSGPVAFSFSAESGASYPEPGTGAVLLLGLIASFTRVRRRIFHLKDSVA